MADAKLKRQIESIQKTVLAARARIEKLQLEAARLEREVPNSHVAVGKMRDAAGALKGELSSGLHKAVIDLNVPAAAANAVAAAVKRL